MDFRHYDASIGRFMVVDPMAEERNWLTPYNFVQNNPILRVDPTGLLDDYGLDQNGNIELIKETNDDTDTLYSVTRGKDGELVKDNNGEVVKNDTNGDGQVADGDSVTVSKNEDGTSVVSELADSNLENKKLDSKFLFSTKTIANFGEKLKDDVFNVFKFASDNSVREWSVVKSSVNGEVNYQLGTYHKHNYAPGFNGKGTFLGLLHSHPNQPTARDRTESLYGDLSIGAKYLRKHGKNLPYLIYFPDSGTTTKIRADKKPIRGLKNFKF
ncbi:MAG: hypothetical protein GKR88_21305 [Flavobacteriaceae bacterium]|nr:MAG: hypothetical protein GKR88_21305 [Flavobacteriaceae bacterium]